MAFIVEVFRNRDEKGYVIIEFRFTIWEWKELLDIGIDNGWSQQGTLKPDEEDYHFFEPDYTADYPYMKIISADDCFLWYRSLLRFHASKYYNEDEDTYSEEAEDDIAIEVEGPLLMRMDKNSLSSRKSGISKSTLEKFMDFLYNRGECYFWADD
jgi:hypothetical protein